MQFKKPRNAFVVGALAIALGCGFPAIALGEEGATDMKDDVQLVLMEDSSQDQNETDDAVILAEGNDSGESSSDEGATTVVTPGDIQGDGG